MVLGLFQAPYLIFDLLLGAGQASFSAVLGPGCLLQVLPRLQEVGVGVLEGPRGVQTIFTLEVQATPYRHGGFEKPTK